MKITICTGGKVGYLGFLQENEDILKEIKTTCYSMSGISPTNQSEIQQG